MADTDMNHALPNQSSAREPQRFVPLGIPSTSYPPLRLSNLRSNITEP